MKSEAEHKQLIRKYEVKSLIRLFTFTYMRSGTYALFFDNYIIKDATKAMRDYLLVKLIRAYGG